MKIFQFRAFGLCQIAKIKSIVINNKNININFDPLPMALINTLIDIISMINLLLSNWHAHIHIICPSPPCTVHTSHNQLYHHNLLRKESFNNYITFARVGGVHHFVTSIVKAIVMNNRLVLQKGGWGYKDSKFSVTNLLNGL